MAGDSNQAAAARRWALAAVCSLGATGVQLQMPAPPVAGDDAEELGLSTPQFQMLPVEPVVVKRTAKGVELRVAASTLEQVFGISGAGAIATAVHTVSSAVVGDQLFVVAGVQAISAGGSECLYRLLLQPHGTEVV